MPFCNSGPTEIVTFLNLQNWGSDLVIWKHSDENTQKTLDYIGRRGHRLGLEREYRRSKAGQQTGMILLGWGKDFSAKLSHTLNVGKHLWGSVCEPLLFTVLLALHPLPSWAHPARTLNTIHYANHSLICTSTPLLRNPKLAYPTGYL